MRLKLSRKTGSSAASRSRASSIRRRNAFGLCPTAFHSVGCSRAKSSRVARSQLYQRLPASSSSRASRSGIRGLTSTMYGVPGNCMGTKNASGAREAPSVHGDRPLDVVQQVFRFAALLVTLVRELRQVIGGDVAGDVL